ncbi:MAG: hypothetical protein M5R36_06930 [Deltaproteobacteria bacterium]|nr:hypothetical protein [Deltaproteobacteria bacterium]
MSLAPTILRIAGILPLDHMDTNDLLAGGSKERIPLLSPYETGEATLSATGAPVITRAPLT